MTLLHSISSGLQDDHLSPYIIFPKIIESPRLARDAGAQNSAKIRALFLLTYLLKEFFPELQRRLPHLEGDEIPDWLGRFNHQKALDRMQEELP